MKETEMKQERDKESGKLSCPTETFIRDSTSTARGTDR